MQDHPPTQSDSSDAADRPLTPAERRQLPRLRYQMLARLWCLVSPPAVLLLFYERAWLRATTLTDSLAAVRLEQWVALVLLGLHGWFWWRGRSANG